jgi:threonine dehydratase
MVYVRGMPEGILSAVRFAAGSKLRRDDPVPTALRLIRTTLPATWVVFADGRGLGIPTDQLLSADDAGGAAAVAFGGMQFDGLEDGWLCFRRVREILPEDQLAPERGRLLKVRPADVATVAASGRLAWPRTDTVDREHIAAIAPLIAPHVRRTPVVQANLEDFGLPPGDLWLKMESLQHSGSFKARGAFVHLLTRELPPAGVVAASGGNHGVAVAYAAMRRGVAAHIFVPTVSSPAKIQRIRDYGADLVVGGDRYADALEASMAYARESGALVVHAYDQRETLLGQGTVGWELEQQVPGVDTVMVPVGGGGLIGGVAAWFSGKVKVVGVEPENAPTLKNAVRAGHPVDVTVSGVAADSLGARRIGELVFPITQQYVKQVVLVPDDAIKVAQELLWSALRVVAEPAGATPLAALIAGAYVPGPGERVAVVLSGGNTTAVKFG